MALYAKESDMNLQNNILVYLTGEDNDGASTVDEDVLSKALVHADSVVDSYIGTKYVLPLTIVIPVFLKQLAVSVAIYHLYYRKGQKIPDDVRLDYEDAKQGLQDIADGKRTLGTSTEDQSDAAGSTTVPIGRT